MRPIQSTGGVIRLIRADRGHLTNTDTMGQGSCESIAGNGNESDMGILDGKWYIERFEVEVSILLERNLKPVLFFKHLHDTIIRGGKPTSGTSPFTEIENVFLHGY